MIPEYFHQWELLLFLFLPHHLGRPSCYFYTRVPLQSASPFHSLDLIRRKWIRKFWRGGGGNGTVLCLYSSCFSFTRLIMLWSSFSIFSLCLSVLVSFRLFFPPLDLAPSALNLLNSARDDRRSGPKNLWSDNHHPNASVHPFTSLSRSVIK